MAKDRFADNPYPGLEMDAEKRNRLIELVNELVAEHLQKYETFLSIDKGQVDQRRWKHSKSRENLRVYSERRQKEAEQSENNDVTSAKDMPVVLRVGTLSGKLDDLMFGVMSPTLDMMRVKASYVHDLDAVLCSIVTPSEDEPFRSVVIKRMIVDAPLQSTTIVKVRDIVCIEATGFVNFDSGDRVGYQIVHSIEFPQTKPLPNIIRANISYFDFFRQTDNNVIDVFGSSTVAPGGDVMRFISIRVATEALLAACSFIYCGQMKKLSWMLQRQNAAKSYLSQKTEDCVVCNQKLTSGITRGIGNSECKICYGHVCVSCKIRRRVTFVTHGHLTRRKVTFCTMCVSEAVVSSAKEAARDKVAGSRVYEALSGFYQSETD